MLFTGCGLFYYSLKAPQEQDGQSFTKNTNSKNNPESAGTVTAESNAKVINNTEKCNANQDTEGMAGKDLPNNSDKQYMQNDFIYTVSEVIDGDTFKVNEGRTIRMAGINTPEAGQYFYEEAKEALSLMIDKNNIYLEQDITDTDKYGRFLRYVFAGKLFVSLEMVKRGFANIFTVAPDVKYADQFLIAQRYAIEHNLGLWEISANYVGENMEKSGEGKGLSSSGEDLKMVSIELNWDAPGNDAENPNGEYVIIKNESSGNINIGGWTVKDSATKIYEFKYYILGSGKEIFLHSGYGSDSKNIFYWNSSTAVWNNDHDTLYLRDNSGLLIEIFNY